LFFIGLESSVIRTLFGLAK